MSDINRALNADRKNNCQEIEFYLIQEFCNLASDGHLGQNSTPLTISTDSDVLSIMYEKFKETKELRHMGDASFSDFVQVYDITAENYKSLMNSKSGCEMLDKGDLYKSFKLHRKVLKLQDEGKLEGSPYEHYFCSASEIATLHPGFSNYYH